MYRGLLGASSCLLAGAILVGALPSDSTPALAADDAPLHCRAVALIDRATGEAVAGAEDIVFSPDGESALISAYDRTAVDAELAEGGPVRTQGGIYRLDLADLDPRANDVVVEDLSGEFKTKHDFRPHGIDLNPNGPEGAMRLFVINRVHVAEDERWIAKPTIERFTVLPAGTLEHEATLRPSDDGPALCAPNDILALDSKRFFASHSTRACEGFSRFWEETAGLARSYLLYFDGERFHEVARDLAYANGLAQFRDVESGHRRLVVSESRGKRLAVFDSAALERFADEAMPDDDGVAPLYHIEMPGMPDNLTWDADGRLVAAIIPNTFQFGFYRRGWFGVDKSASRAVALTPPINKDSEPQVIFDDEEGEIVSGATVMAGTRTETGPLYLIGVVQADTIGVCTLPGDSALVPADGDDD